MSHPERNVRKVAADSAATGPERRSQNTMPPEERHRMIAERAYLNAERRGFQGGRHEEEWYEAEAQVDTLLAGLQGGERD